MRQLIFLLFLFPLIAVGQQSPTQILNTPWQKINYKLEVGQRLLLPADTLSYPPGATVRDTTRLLAFAPNGNLYKLWNGVWSLIGAGGGSDVQLLGDTAIVVGDDTVRIKPITFESDMPPAYFFKDGDTIRDYTLQYLNDSVKIRKSGDTLFFPNGDTVLLGAAGIPDASGTQRGLVSLGDQVMGTGKKTFDSLALRSGGVEDYVKKSVQNNAFSPLVIIEKTRNVGSLTAERQFETNGNATFAFNERQVNIYPQNGAVASGFPIVGNASGGRATSTYPVLVLRDRAGMTLSVGNTSQRPSTLTSTDTGTVRINSDSAYRLEINTGSTWRAVAWAGEGGGGSGTVTTGYGINGDGSGGDPLRVDSAELREHIARVARDSLSFRFFNSGTSGERIAWTRNDSAFIKRLVAGTDIVINNNPDSSLTIEVQDTSFIRNQNTVVDTMRFNVFDGGLDTLRMRGRIVIQEPTPGNDQFAFIHFENTGRTIFGTRNDGSIRFGHLGSKIDPVTQAAGSLAINGGGLAIRAGGGGSTEGWGVRIGYSSNRTYTTVSGGGNTRFDETFAPTSGTAPFAQVQIAGTINQTGGASGITRGLWISPTLTSAADWRAIEVTTGNTLLGTTSGGLGVGVSSIAASAKVEIASTTQGFLPPRMTATQASAISSPAEGLLVYVTDTNGTFTSKGWWGYNGSAWEKLNN